MRHLKRTAKLGRTGEHRNAMLANMVCCLIKSKRITTTLAKAKVLRPVVEKLVTLGRRGNRAVEAAATADDKKKAAFIAENVHCRRPWQRVCASMPAPTSSARPPSKAKCCAPSGARTRTWFISCSTRSPRCSRHATGLHPHSQTRRTPGRCCPVGHHRVCGERDCRARRGPQGRRREVSALSILYRKARSDRAGFFFGARRRGAVTMLPGYLIRETGDAEHAVTPLACRLVLRCGATF